MDTHGGPVRVRLEEAGQTWQRGFCIWRRRRQVNIISQERNESRRAYLMKPFAVLILGNPCISDNVLTLRSALVI